MSSQVIQQIERGVSERVYFEFRDSNRALKNPDSTPTVTFKDANGNFIIDNSSNTLQNVNLTNEATGIYYYTLTLKTTETLNFIYGFPKATINSSIQKLDKPLSLEVIESEVVPSNQLLTSLFFVKDYLHIGNSENDKMLDMLINRVSKNIETWCNRKFKERNITEYHDGDGENGFIYILNPPITSLQSIYDDPDRVFGSDTLFVTADRVTYNEEGKIQLIHTSTSKLVPTDKPVFSNSKQNIKITYTGGYATIPSDIQMAATLWVANEFKFIEEKRFGLTQREIGDKSQVFVKRTGLMPIDVKTILDNYRLISI